MASPLLEGVDAIFFDLFDTLIRIDPDRLPATRFGGRTFPTTVPIVHEQVLAPLGVEAERFTRAFVDVAREIETEKRASTIEISGVERARRIVARLGLAEGDDAEALALRLAETHGRALAQAARPVEGARELLDRLLEREFAVALISNFDLTRAAEWILEETGLIGVLDKRVVSETVGVRKPDPRIFQEALDHFDVTPEAAVHVGDQPKIDAWGAARVGMRTVWINPKGRDYEPDEHPPTLVVSQLHELREHV